MHEFDVKVTKTEESNENSKWTLMGWIHAIDINWRLIIKRNNMHLWNSNVIFNRKLERNCDVEFSKGNGQHCCCLGEITAQFHCVHVVELPTTKVRSIFEFRVGHQNWWITLNLDQNHMYVNFRFSKGFSFLNQCFAQLRSWKSVSDSQNLLAGATAVLLKTLFKKPKSCKTLI